MPPGSVERQIYRSFWDKFSSRADNTSMLLNANADQIEELDRAEIMGMLPSFEDKFVVDIGAGIGRFTTEFAQKARKVLSTDFMDNFIERNRQRNASFDNIEWRVGDALGLQLEGESVDLVFTNWLLMYLSDEESCRFLANVLRWLRPGGHLHLRESCSEPSTPKTGGTSLHSQADTNPTRYRLSSAYIQLLRHIRFQEPEDGQRSWRFQLHWACSVEVYIEKNSNWRQVHWLASKVPAESSAAPPGHLDIVDAFASQWPNEQRSWEQRMETQMPTNKMLTARLLADQHSLLLQHGIGPDSLLFSFNGRQSADQPGFDAHTLVESLGCRLWSVETSPQAYRHSLTLANQQRDRRVRVGWHGSMQSAVHFWAAQKPAQNNNGEKNTGEEEEGGGGRRHTFDGFLGVQLLDHIESPADVAAIAALLASDGQLVSLEADKIADSKLELLQTRFTIEKCVEFRTEADGLPMKKLLLLVARKMPKTGLLNGGCWKQPINEGF